MSLVIKTQYLRIDRIAQPRCALGNRVKQRLKIACSGDHPQDVVGGVLPLQRLGEFVGSSAIVCACLAGEVFTTAPRGFTLVLLEPFLVVVGISK